jgi:hypothetical protein
MSQSLNLKELERQAYLRTFEDGLLDIYMGGLLASFAAFGFTVFPGNKSSSLITLLYFLAGVGLSSLVFWLGKRNITLPRIGLVKFGPARQKRARDLFLALAVIVAVQVLVIVLQFSYLLPPAVHEWLAPLLGAAESSNLLIAVVGAIFVAPGMLLIAYMTDNPRGYYHAVVLTLAVFLMILLDQAWWMVLGGVLILLPGVVHFVRFLQRYPLEDLPDERR